MHGNVIAGEDKDFTERILDVKAEL